MLKYRYSGDACHPMLPYLAQGANSSLEDGAVLGLLLGHMRNKSQLPQILRLYQSLRKSRGEAIVRETFKQVGTRSRSQVSSKLFSHGSRRDMTSICPMARSRRSAMSCSYRSLGKRLKAHFLVDGKWIWDLLPADADIGAPGRAPKCNHGCTGMMLSKRWRKLSCETRPCLLDCSIITSRLDIADLDIRRCTVASQVSLMD